MMVKAKLNSKSIATDAGDITVFHYDGETREYLSSSVEYLTVGLGIPANSCVDAPNGVKEGVAVCRTTDGTAWEIVDDLRGKVAYSTETSQPEEVRFIGELPDTLTLLAPNTAFDKWNGSKWVTDKALQQAAATQEAEEKKTRLLNAAAAKIAPLQDAVDTGMATDGEKPHLTAWKTYRVLLNRIDTSKAPDITWPQLPE